jgi:hypothetical protein
MIVIMHKTTLIVLLPLCLLGGAVKAAEQAKPSPAAKPLSACSLVTKPEVEHAIGMTISAVEPMKSPRADACAFTTQKGGAKVAIFAARSQEKRDLSKALDKIRTAMPSANVRELPGLGEKALLVEHPTLGTMLSVYRAGDSLVVSVSDMRDVAKADAAAEMIARKAFSRF